MLYRCSIARDGDHRQIIVHWDDLDPNRHITAPVTVPVAELDESRLEHELGRKGFRLASSDSDNVGRGWAIVARIQSDRSFFNPINRIWCSSISGEEKRAINDKWPGAEVPGARR